MEGLNPTQDSCDASLTGNGIGTSGGVKPGRQFDEMSSSYDREDDARRETIQEEGDEGRWEGKVEIAAKTDRETPINTQHN